MPAHGGNVVVTNSRAKGDGVLTQAASAVLKLGDLVNQAQVIKQYERSRV
jgi:hypothetical protein